jgi:hypothetical protein
MNDEELDLKRRIATAERARVIIEDPLLSSAFDALDARFMMAWRNTSSHDTDGRERLWHHVQALGEVRRELETILSDGLIARDALEDLKAGISNP